MLDRLDRRLLLALDRNARMSYSALSKGLSMPEETVRYRTNALVRSGIIKNFLTIFDAGKLGVSYYKILMKLHNVDEAGVEGISRHLLGQEAVNWVARLDGMFDLAFTIRVAHLQDLSMFLDALREKFYRFIHRLVMAVNIEVDFFAREYLVPGSKRQKGSSAIYTVSGTEMKIDELDRSILRVLSNKPRISAKDLAATFSVSAPTISSRISAMERAKVITGYRLLLDSALTGHFNYYVLLYLNMLSKERLSAFTGYCKSQPNITYFIKALGEWDYELNIEAETVGQYRTLMMNLTKEFSDIIRDYSGMAVLAVHKLTLSP